MATANTNLSDYNTDKVPSGAGMSIAIVVSEWNKQITEALYKGAYETLVKHNVSENRIVRIDVPGSFELIYGAKEAQSRGVNVVIVIGSVIQGETKHFDFICEGVTHGIKDLNIKSKIPVIFCVLTDANLQQAIDRSGGKHGNKGVEAAIAALKMAHLSKQ